MKTASLLYIVSLLAVANAASAQGPVDYPPESTSVSTLTRAEVEADLLAARANGQHMKPYALRSYIDWGKSVKPRAEVVAELREAQRLGLVGYGEVEARIATPEQERQIAEAGRRAVEQAHVAVESLKTSPR
jgi:hypothetical protein